MSLQLSLLSHLEAFKQRVDKYYYAAGNSAKQEVEPNLSRVLRVFTKPQDLEEGAERHSHGNESDYRQLKQTSHTKDCPVLQEDSRTDLGDRQHL